jgi:hypothetical protein
MWLARPWTGLHADLYSSKFPPRTLQYFDQRRCPLPNQTGGGASGADEGEFGQAGLRNLDLRSEGGGQALPYMLENGDFAPAAVQKAGQGRFGR